MNIFKRKRYGYLFGYGSDTNGDILKVLSHRRPEYLGDAILHGYEQRIQYLDEVTNPKVHDILQRNWGNDFRSYVIVKNDGVSVRGRLFKIRIDDRHVLDQWELVDLGWCQKIFVDVTLFNGKTYTAETQALAPGQTARGIVADKGATHPWLQPKKDFVRIASNMPR